jgi:sarcosine oxidase
VPAEYDAIVIGLGAMGSAAAYQLAVRGQRVLGLEAFPRGHTLGSSHGESRIIRMAYFEHADYVPLLKRAYALWGQMQAAASVELLRLTGGLFIGPPDGELVAGSRRSAEAHGVPHALLDAREIVQRFPALRPRPDEIGLYEETAGVLFPERCIAAQLDLARQAGAELHHAEPVESWAGDTSGLEVRTAGGRFQAGRLVLTAGAWLGKLLASLHLPLQPERIPLFWFEPTPELPVFIWQTGADEYFFGIPHLEWLGTKVGRHHSEQPCDPDTVDRDIHPADEQRIRRFVEHCIPDLNGPLAAAKICLYTNTPDGHFLIDRHPELPNVVFAGGFSGHGFKFASVVGEILADLLLDGRATPAAEFLRLERFSAPKSAAGVFR